MRLVAAIFAMSLALSWAPTAEAARGDARTETRNPGATSRPAATRPATGRPAPTRTSSGQRAAAQGISCVPYARQVTGMDISGNGRDWWHNAAGRFARGQRPEPGSILSFPASGGMRHGHVAVVSRVVDSRMIEIDHANWGGPGIRRGTVMRGVRVMDVSDANDWTQVRVQVGWTAEAFGRAYPTHGFIHNRPAGSGGEMLAANAPAQSRAQAQPGSRQQQARAPISTARATPAQARRPQAQSASPARVANRPIQQASASR